MGVDHKNDATLLGRFILQRGVDHVPAAAGHAFAGIFGKILARRIDQNNRATGRVLGADEFGESHFESNRIFFQSLLLRQGRKGVVAKDFDAFGPVFSVALGCELKA